MSDLPSKLHREKNQTIKRLFEDEWLLVHVDTRAEGVNVPEHLNGRPSVTFKISRLFPGVTEISNSGVKAHLLFGSERFMCMFPFDSIWGVTSHRGSNILWPESTPPEILAEMNGPQKQAETTKDDGEKTAPEKKGRPALKRVK